MLANHATCEPHGKSIPLLDGFSNASPCVCPPFLIGVSCDISPPSLDPPRTARTWRSTFRGTLSLRAYRYARPYRPPPRRHLLGLCGRIAIYAPFHRGSCRPTIRKNLAQSLVSPNNHRKRAKSVHRQEGLRAPVENARERVGGARRRGGFRNSYISRRKEAAVRLALTGTTGRGGGQSRISPADNHITR